MKNNYNLEDEPNVEPVPQPPCCICADGHTPLNSCSCSCHDDWYEEHPPLPEEEVDVEESEDI